MNTASKLYLPMIAILLAVPSASHADWVDEFDGLLKAHVTNGRIDGIGLKVVDYAVVARDDRYTTALRGLAAAKEPTTRDEKLAYWINAYNLLAIKMMVEHPKVESIRDIGSMFKSVWKMDAGVAAGRTRTLDEIEHKILRPMKEPRIHVAIVCASVSCPDLWPEAYRAKTLDEQLTNQSRRFLINRDKGVLSTRSTVRVSSIFKWFADDFDDVGGVTGFIEKYSSIKTKDKKLVYFDYNWKPNAKPATGMTR